jgi:ANTAR domain-containing protein/GAF domain-containing protein
VGRVEELRERFEAALGAARGAAAADRLCQACVELLAVDGAAISLVLEGKPTGTFGCNDPTSRELDEVQFTLGEGPGLDAVAQAMPILVPDLADAADQRWPAYSAAVLQAGMAAVYALPVVVANMPAGCLTLFRARPGPLDSAGLGAGLVVAEFAALPLLDVMSEALDAAVTKPGSQAWAELAVLSRVEVNQATGVLVAQLEIEPPDALVRLRAYAFANDMSASDVARDVIAHRLRLDADDSWRRPGQNGERT